MNEQSETATLHINRMPSDLLFKLKLHAVLARKTQKQYLIEVLENAFEEELPEKSSLK